MHQSHQLPLGPIKMQAPLLSQPGQIKQQVKAQQILRGWKRKMEEIKVITLGSSNKCRI
jgi:hypothetical protein